MTIIGNFTKQDDSYQGAISTLTVKAKVNITPAEKSSEKAPDFRVYAGNAEIGAAWSAVSKAGKPYLNVKFNDPALAVGFFRLVATANQEAGGHALMWNP